MAGLRCGYTRDGLRCRFRADHRGKHSLLKVKMRTIKDKRFLRPPERPHPLSSVAADAHILVDRALTQGRAFLYVDGKGRIRDVRADADVAALPPRPLGERPAAIPPGDYAIHESGPARRIPPEDKQLGTSLSQEALRKLVNHPSYYGGDSRYEVIKVLEAHKLNYNIGNAVAYLLRHENKGEPLRDLEKALWFIQREITLRTAPTCADCDAKMLPAPQGTFFCDNCGSGSGAS
jgi:Protein of unknwon function (DUF3310)